ncbi:MAG: hypothetical protein Q7S87_16115 [Agitococcus sp.]|nr:hypothetical protein [Agitococcus sp.]MDO9179070.1 hypothetical protein [Agitococcus sp.]
MSIRRTIGDIVRLQDSDDDSEFLAKIVAHAGGTEPDDCYRSCGDSACREWPVLALVSDDGVLTGDRVFHWSECAMKTPLSESPASET